MRLFGLLFVAYGFLISWGASATTACGRTDNAITGCRFGEESAQVVESARHFLTDRGGENAATLEDGDDIDANLDGADQGARVPASARRHDQIGLFSPRLADRRTSTLVGTIVLMI